jgi:hypothetical protein
MKEDRDTIIQIIPPPPGLVAYFAADDRKNVYASPIICLALVNHDVHGDSYQSVEPMDMDSRGVIEEVCPMRNLITVRMAEETISPFELKRYWEEKDGKKGQA